MLLSVWCAHLCLLSSSSSLRCLSSEFCLVAIWRSFLKASCTPQSRKHKNSEKDFSIETVITVESSFKTGSPQLHIWWASAFEWEISLLAAIVPLLHSPHLVPLLLPLPLPLTVTYSTDNWSASMRLWRNNSIIHPTGTVMWLSMRSLQNTSFVL